MNSFPPKSGILEHISPRSLFTGVKVDFKKHCKVPFGDYVQTHEDNVIKNDNKTRTVGAICLGPAMNMQGGYKFMSLATGRLLSRANNAFAHLPMPNHVVKRILDLGKNSPEGLVIADQHGIDDVESDMEEDDNISTTSDGCDTQSMCGSNEYEEDPDIAVKPVEESTGVDHDGCDTQSINSIAENIEAVLDNEIDEFNNADEQVTQQLETVEEESSQESPVKTRSGRVIRKPTLLDPSIKGKSYDKELLFMTILRKVYNRHLFNQFSLKVGEKVFGKKGTDAAYKEMEQLHFRNTFKPVLPSNLSEGEKKKVIESLMFLKEKRDGTIKGRTCGDGR